MEKLHYYVLVYFYQYTPYTTFQALYAHKEKVDFNQVWKEVRDELEKNYPYASYDEDAEEEYHDFIGRKADEILVERGFIKIEADETTIGPDDSYDTFRIWES